MESNTSKNEVNQLAKFLAYQAAVEAFNIPTNMIKSLANWVITDYYDNKNIKLVHINIAKSPFTDKFNLKALTSFRQKYYAHISELFNFCDLDVVSYASCAPVLSPLFEPPHTKKSFKEQVHLGGMPICEPNYILIGSKNGYNHYFIVQKREAPQILKYIETQGFTTEYNRFKNYSLPDSEIESISTQNCRIACTYTKPK